jgi:uncharacterized protein YjbI with pentapeptide repeats
MSSAQLSSAQLSSAQLSSAQLSSAQLSSAQAPPWLKCMDNGELKTEVFQFLFITVRVRIYMQKRRFYGFEVLLYFIKCRIFSSLQVLHLNP